MTFDFTLQPERKGGVVDACFSGDIDLFDVVFGEGLQHLGSYIFFDDFSHVIIGSKYYEEDSKRGATFYFSSSFIIFRCNAENRI